VEVLEGTPDVFVIERAVRIWTQSHARASGRLCAPAVLPGKPAAGERRVRLVAEVCFLDRREHVGRVARVEQRIRVLDAAIPAGRFEQQGVCYVRPAVCANLPGGDELVEDAEGLVERGGVVGLVREIEVDTVDTDPIQARFELSADAGRS